MKISTTFDDRASEALARADGVLRRHLDEALSRGAQEVADAARRRAPKNVTTLTHSIKASADGDLAYVVRSGAAYAPYVERGVPGPLPRWPNMYALQDWVRQKLGVSDDQASDRLAFLIGRSIKAKGIKAQPFMRPARDEKENRVRAMVKGAIARGLAEIGDGR